MLGFKITRIRVLIGLAIFLSAWLVVSGASNNTKTSQAELFSQNTGMSSLNKITGLPDPGT